MKRILYLLAGCLLMIINMQAQNANRRGFFIELEGGTAIGTVMDTDYHGPYIKGGLVGSVDFGYRFVTSRAFAVEAKIDAWSNFLDFEKCFYLDIMPGIRWTSKEITSNVSMFLSLNAGLGLSPSYVDYFPFVPIEIGVGANLTNQFYIGLFLRETVVGDYSDRIDYNDGIYDESIGKPYTSVGLKLGYRF